MASLTKTSTSVKLKDFKLHLLLEVTKAINENASREELFHIYEESLQKKLKIGKLALFINETEWKCVIKSGIKDIDFNIDVEKDLLPIKNITYVNLTPLKHFEVFDVIIPVFHKDQPLAYLLIGDIDEERIDISPTIKHRPFIETLTNIIVVAIENKKLAKDQLKQERIKKELELASEMQAMLFPGKLPCNDKLEAAAFYLPNEQVGGDYYDFIQLNDHEVVFCMADVSGKGIPAAFLMSNFQAYLRTLIKHIPLFYLVQRLNSKVMESAKGEKFITMFIGKYDINTRVLNYVNAGQNPPLLLFENEKNETQFLKAGCTGLGMFEELPKVDEGNITISENATLICYTDGVVELENENSEEFGQYSLINTFRKHKYSSMQALIDSIKDELEKFKGKRPYIDDIALFCCRFY